MQAAIASALTEASKAAKPPPAKLRRTPRRGAQFARGCDGLGDSGQTASGPPMAAAATAGARSQQVSMQRGRAAARRSPLKGSHEARRPAAARSAIHVSGSVSRKRGRPGPSVDAKAGECSHSDGVAAEAAPATAVVMPPGEDFPCSLMWGPEEYYSQQGPVFRVAPGGNGGLGGRAGTAVPASLVGALPDSGTAECKEAVVQLSCSLEGLDCAARAVMHAPMVRSTVARQRRASGGKAGPKTRDRAERKAGPRSTLPGGAARAFVFQVLSTQRVMQRLKRAIGQAVGGAHAVDMSASQTLGAPAQAASACCHAFP